MDETQRNKLKRSSLLQAHFQVSAKNNLPLLKFAVENSDVLLATPRKFSSTKNDPTWIYTFFNVHETRRKSGGWLSQGSKVKDYVQNVVAQMKVSDLPVSSLGEHLTVDQLSIREFVLYAVDLPQFDHQTCDRQPNDELAAIVVKFSRKTITGVEDSSQISRVSSNLRDLQEDKSIVGSEELFSTTVLLPGGSHGLPSKAEPSPLIERWFSGGQCDCGGWDLGCKVNVFSNNNLKSDGRFELFSQSQVSLLTTILSPFFVNIYLLSNVLILLHLLCRRKLNKQHHSSVCPHSRMISSRWNLIQPFHFYKHFPLVLQFLIALSNLSFNSQVRFLKIK